MTKIPKPCRKVLAKGWRGLIGITSPSKQWIECSLCAEPCEWATGKGGAMNLYGVMLYDDCLDMPVPDGRVYLTREDARKRADRMTYEDELGKHWAYVVELRCAWDVDALGPWPDGPNANWLRWVRFAQNLRLECDRARNESAELRELVRDMGHEGAFEPGAYCAKAAPRLEERTRELGIEVAYE